MIGVAVEEHVGGAGLAREPAQLDDLGSVVVVGAAISLAALGIVGRSRRRRML
jgi:hypothetical protein